MLPPSVYGNADIPAEEEASLQSMSDEEIAAGVARGSVSYRFEQRLREENALIKIAIDTENERKRKQAEESRHHFQEVFRIEREKTLRFLLGEQVSPEELPSPEIRRDWCGTSRLEQKLLKRYELDGRNSDR